MPESHWIPRLFDKREGLTPEGLVTPELIPHLFEQRQFARLHFGSEEVHRLLKDGWAVPYADFVARIFDLYGEREGKSVVGDKTPAYVRRLPTLHALWPKVRFVHLIRDGRDVCLSMREWPKVSRIEPGMSATWKAEPVSTAALWWQLSVRLGRHAGNLLEPESYYEIRYESLVNNPAKECAALCAFLDLPYDEAMLRFHEGKTKSDPSLETKRAWLPVVPGLRSWRSQMPTADVERFEAAAGDLLEELGYAPAVPSPGAKALEHASEIRAALARDSKWNEVFSHSRGKGPEPASTIPDSRTDAAGSLEGRAQL